MKKITKSSIKSSRSNLMIGVLAVLGGVLGILGLGTYSAVQALSGETISLCITHTGSVYIMDTENMDCRAQKDRVVTINTEGPIGPMGPAGPGGSQTVIGETRSTTPGLNGVTAKGVTLTAKVSCPEGKKVLGGGGEVRTSGTQTVVNIKASYPSSETEWTAVGVVADNLNGVNMLVTPYVICNE